MGSSKSGADSVKMEIHEVDSASLKSLHFTGDAGKKGAFWMVKLESRLSEVPGGIKSRLDEIPDM